MDPKAGKARMPISVARSGDPRSGYTLAELLVVLVVIGLAVAFVAPRLFATSDAAIVRTAADTIELAARTARTQARLSGRESRLVIDVDARQITIEPIDRDFSLPREITIRATVAETELDDELAAIRFFPDGGATGGRYDLQSDDAELSVSVDWITGLSSRGLPDEDA